MTVPWLPPSLGNPHVGHAIACVPVDTPETLLRGDAQEKSPGVPLKPAALSWWSFAVAVTAVSCTVRLPCDRHKMSAARTRRLLLEVYCEENAQKDRPAKPLNLAAGVVV